MHSHRVFILESRTENPCVGGSIPPLGTKYITYLNKNLTKYLYLKKRLIKYQISYKILICTNIFSR